LDDPCGPSSAP